MQSPLAAVSTSPCSPAGLPFLVQNPSLPSGLQDVARAWPQQNSQARNPLCTSQTAVHLTSTCLPPCTGISPPHLAAHFTTRRP